MKKFYTKHFEIQWKDRWIRPFRLQDDYVYLTAEEALPQETLYYKFETFWKDMQSKNRYGFQSRITTFRKRPYVRVNECPLDGYQFNITAKNFRPMKTRWIYDEVKTTFHNLSRCVDSDLLMEYCRDRGVDYLVK